MHDVCLEVRKEHYDGTTVISPIGEIDMATAPKLRANLVAADGHVVVDLRDVSFLDACGIGVLAESSQQLSITGGDLVLRRPRGVVRKALEIVGLVDWIEDQD
jgi:anti-sigma B factor antagonist